MTAAFELLPVRRPILSASRLVNKGFVVVMGAALGNKMSKDGREMQLQKSNDVYHVRASALLELCPLEDEDPRNEAAPPQLQTPGHDDFRINPLTMRKRRTQPVTYHSEPGVHTV